MVLHRRPTTGMFLFEPASTGGRQHLTRAQIILWIECPSQVRHSGEVVSGEHLVHELDLLDADPVFASDASATSKTLIQDLAACFQDVFGLFQIAFVEQQDRMDISVAGVENVHDADVVLLANLDDAFQDVR